VSAAATQPPGRARERRGAVRRVVAPLRGLPPALVVLLVLAAAHGVAWAVVTAPLNGPDESAHFAYAQDLAENHHAPSGDTGTGSNSTEAATVLLQLNLLPILLHPEGKPTFSSIDRTNAQLAAAPAGTRKDGTGPNAAASYPPLYYLYEAVAYDISPARGLFGRMFFMRLATTLFLVVTVWLTWLIAAELFARTWVRVLATGLVALQPKLGFGAGVINPDLMLVMVSTGALLMGLRLVRHGPTLGRVLWLAIFAGGGAVIHPRGLFLGPFAVIALVLALWRFWPGWRRAVALSGAVVAITVVGIGVAVAWSRAHAGGGISENPVGGFSARQFVSYVWQFYLPKLGSMYPTVGPPNYGYRQVYIDSFFSQFASFSVSYRLVILDTLQVLAGIGLVALWTTIVTRLPVVLARWREVSVCVVFFLGLMSLLHLVSYLNLRGSLEPVLTGRYLLPAVALYGCAIAWVVSSLPRRVGVVFAGLLLGGALLLAIGGIGLSLDRFYA
jgi:4-amino-4-deoxy-L-arabinose transferase-like glycosyltransferase